jgi:hypothetical protein
MTPRCVNSRGRDTRRLSPDVREAYVIGKQRSGSWPVFLYDPATKKKRYVGCYPTRELAEIAEAEGKARTAKGTTRICPGCRHRFFPIDDTQKRCSPRCEQRIKKREYRRRDRREDNHWVYTCRDAGGVVIYVGITSTGFRRHKEHGRESSWWGDVRFIEVDHFATRELALDAEAKGIATYQPRCNVHGCGNGVGSKK